LAQKRSKTRTKISCFYNGLTRLFDTNTIRCLKQATDTSQDLFVGDLTPLDFKFDIAGLVIKAVLLGLMCIMNGVLLRKVR
jgi:hypothetical protein